MVFVMGFNVNTGVALAVQERHEVTCMVRNTAIKTSEENAINWLCEKGLQVSSVSL